jgi:hypothetical protein|tara:strand:+ start:915 stop:1112 length:198 start_codon:yes stop_codon:yes gene_type:complete
MAEYIMAIKTRNAGDQTLNAVIWRTQASTLSEAKQYFVALKRLDEQEFDRMFVVTEVRKDTDERS